MKKSSILFPGIITVHREIKLKIKSKSIHIIEVNGDLEMNLEQSFILEESVYDFGARSKCNSLFILEFNGVSFRTYFHIIIQNFISKS